MKIDVTCVICNKNEKVYPSRATNYKTCSKECLREYKKGKDNCTCSQCGKEFHLKPYSIKRYNRTLGTFCSQKCCYEFKKIAYNSYNNPNFRNSYKDHDGYLMIHIKEGSFKEHHYVVFKHLNIWKLPKNYAVHHRDCNIYNNNPENLSLLSWSDHRWLHKQFGNATLWAFMNNKVSLENLVEWANDKERAKRLLQLNILIQTGVFKSDELLENLGEDNQQPSQKNA